MLISKARISQIALMIVFVSACSSTSHIMIGEARGKIPVSEVEVYRQQPAEYEQIALLKASSRNSLSFSDEGMIEVAINRLKQEAADLGANGVLITRSTDEVTGSFGSGTGVSGRNVGVGIGLSMPINNKSVSAIAIYVLNPELLPESTSNNEQMQNTQSDDQPR